MLEYGNIVLKNWQEFPTFSSIVIRVMFLLFLPIVTLMNHNKVDVQAQLRLTTRVRFAHFVLRISFSSYLVCTRYMCMCVRVRTDFDFNY